MIVYVCIRAYVHIYVYLYISIYIYAGGERDWETERMNWLAYEELMQKFQVVHFSCGECNKEVEDDRRER